MLFQLKTYLSVFMAVSLMLSLGVQKVPAADSKKNGGGKAATVNGVVITEEHLKREVFQFRRQYARQGRPLSDGQLSEVKKAVLENLIGRELLYQESSKDNIEISDQIISEQIKRIRKQFTSETEYQKFLDEMKVSEEEVKAKIRQDMAIRRYVEKKIANKITVPAKDVRSYYDLNPDYFKQPDQIRASHILIKVDPSATQQQKDKARKEIKKIQKKLKGGEDFAGLARQVSQGPSSKRGGDLGYFGRGRMVKPFEDAAFGLNPGDVSDIVETQFGYHLIKVVDKKPATVIAFEQARGQIEQVLKQEKVRNKVRMVVEDLKRGAEIVRF
jgi:peptidyl-prolyl cis-trans isomerase C